MPPKPSGKAAPKASSNVKPAVTIKEEPPVGAPPESSSDEDENDAANMIRTWTTGKVGKAGSGSKKATVNSYPTRSSRNEATNASPTSSGGSSSLKRKSEPDRFLGKSGKDPFGRMPMTKVKNTYGSSSQSRSLPSQSSSASQKTAGSPKRTFQIKDLQFDFGDSPSNSQSSESSPKKKKLSLVKPAEIGSSQEKSKTPKKGFEAPAVFGSSPTSTPDVDTGFKIPGPVDDSWGSDSKGGGSFTDAGKLDENSPASTPPYYEKLAQISANAVPRTRDPKKLLEYTNLAGEMTSRVRSLVGDFGNGMLADTSDLFDDEFEISTTKTARCPMCKQPCDASELKKMGTMNTRQQEKFCRSHRKTHAEKKWESKGYPDINWDRLDSRISEHYDFIRTLLHGAECPYRQVFEELVAAGKLRAGKKMEVNPTPGYYGSRGSGMISAHIIREFSELISDRSMDDGLISKRGTATFIQLVIVPEVTVHLIMQDMLINEEEARVVLADSSKIGELVHEEIRDVVMEPLEDSDDWDVREH